MFIRLLCIYQPQIWDNSCCYLMNVYCLHLRAAVLNFVCFQEGAGLGRSGQGMSTALKVERLGKNSGVIVNEHEINARGLFQISYKM